MRLVIGSRQSDLARIQAYAVGEALSKNNPGLQIEYHFRESLGDKNLSDPLWKMPERGVFTEDFYQGLVKGEYDIVVHSWKDLPVEDREGTELIATLPRADMRDLLLLKKDAVGRSSLRILTSSPRRQHNLSESLASLLPSNPQSISFEPVRGNVQTRVRKLIEGPQQGLIVAKAALDRMLTAERAEFQATRTFLREALENLQWMVLPLTLNPTAAAQGALAVEAKTQREDIKKLFEGIHDPVTFATVQEERRILKGWGGGCHQKIGIAILDRAYGRVLLARGERDSGEVIELQELQGASKISGSACFEFPEWFDREALSFQYSPGAYNAHWVSKAEALPITVTPLPSDLVWTSGVSTWKVLARRGIWVNGSAESFGETENMRLAALVPQERSWVKWTHEQGTDFALGDVLRTYRLVAKRSSPPLSAEYQHYFWKSGSAFTHALKLHPWLGTKEHWCGPGHTQNAIAQLTGRAPHIAFNYEQWQKRMKQGK